MTDMPEFSFCSGLRELAASRRQSVLDRFFGQYCAMKRPTFLLVRAAIASSSQLDFLTMIGICGENTMQMFRNVGFLIENSLGKNGGFPYPSEELTAHVVGILNAVSLETALSYDKEIMTYLRKNTSTSRIESNNDFISNISYNLVYNNVKSINYGRINNKLV